MQAPKFAFVTCVELGLRCMDEIYRVGGKLDVVVTLHDEVAPRKSGRVYVDDFCQKHGIELWKVRNVNEPECVATLQARDIDWLFIIGWSQIAHNEVLNAPKLGALGMHPTLLPEGRGRAAIPWAILHRLPRTGVTLFRLAEAIDAGDIVAQEVVPMAEDETATVLYKKVAAAHASLIVKAWPLLVSGTVQFIKQDESRATYWSGRKPEDGRIDRDMECAAAECLVRAVTRPYPGAFIDTERTRYRIWKSYVERGRMHHRSVEEHAGLLTVPLRDGALIAVEWEVEPLATPQPLTI